MATRVTPPGGDELIARHKRETKYIFLGGTRIAGITTVGSTAGGRDQVMFYHMDHLGGTNVVTDSDGAVKELTEYLPFGEFSRRERYGSGEEVARYYFTGKPFDDETGLIYFGARYYDPTVGRFIQPDPTVQDPTNPVTMKCLPPQAVGKGSK